MCLPVAVVCTAHASHLSGSVPSQSPCVVRGEGVNGGINLLWTKIPFLGVVTAISFYSNDDVEYYSMMFFCFQVFAHWNLQSHRSQNRLGGQHPEIISPAWHVHADRNLRARHPRPCRSSTHLLHIGACKSFQVHGAHERSYCHYDRYSIKVLESNPVFIIK